MGDYQIKACNLGGPFKNFTSHVFLSSKLLLCFFWWYHTKFRKSYGFHSQQYAPLIPSCSRCSCAQPLLRLRSNVRMTTTHSPRLTSHKLQDFHYAFKARSLQFFLLYLHLTLCTREPSIGCITITREIWSNDDYRSIINECHQINCATHKLIYNCYAVTDLWCTISFLKLFYCLVSLLWSIKVRVFFSLKIFRQLTCTYCRV